MMAAMMWGSQERSKHFTIFHGVILRRVDGFSIMFHLSTHFLGSFIPKKLGMIHPIDRELILCFGKG